MNITTKIFIVAVAFLIVGILAGCRDTYRYPCQNVKNWEKPECQKPLCEVHKQCPSHIFGRDPNLDPYIKH